MLQRRLLFQQLFLSKGWTLHLSRPVAVGQDKLGEAVRSSGASAACLLVEVTVRAFPVFSTVPAFPEMPSGARQSVMEGTVVKFRKFLMKATPASLLSISFVLFAINPHFATRP